jgi:hypothetical protein
MLNFIKTIYQLYKIVKFTKQGDLIISFNKSTIRFTKQGDLIINSGRHTIHNRDLFFDGCDNAFIAEAIKNNDKSKKDLEKFVMSSNRASEFVCEINEVTKKIHKKVIIEVPKNVSN